jgi:hypothetical protein
MSTSKILVVGLSCGVVLSGWVGCKREPVEKDQPVSSFETDVEVKLSAFDTRLGEVKSSMLQRPEGVRNTIEVTTEQAEEKIETLRDSTLVQLKQAHDSEEIERIKEMVNSTLTEIDKAIRRAEEANADARSERDVYSEDTSKTIDELRQRYESLKVRAENVEGAVKAEADLALESAEEAIQEAGRSLGEYKKAAQDEAETIRGNIDALLADARESLDKVTDSLTE